MKSQISRENEEMAVQFANFLKVNPSQKYLQMKEEVIFKISKKF